MKVLWLELSLLGMVRHQWQVGLGCALQLWHSKFGVVEMGKVWGGCREIWPCCVFCVEKLVGSSGGTWFRGDFMVVVRRETQGDPRSLGTPKGSQLPARTKPGTAC